jgi:DNA-binding transcriptional MerR regulator
MAETRPEIPGKLYFKIGEVAKIIGVKPYVLRYWETEFAIIRPGKTRSNHRLYRRRDVETLLEIKRLLHDERYTIEGAKRRLKGIPAKPSAPPPEERGQISLPLGERTYREALLRVRRDLEALHKFLERA